MLCEAWRRAERGGVAVLDPGPQDLVHGRRSVTARSHRRNTGAVPGPGPGRTLGGARRTCPRTSVLVGLAANFCQPGCEETLFGPGGHECERVTVCGCCFCPPAQAAQ